MSQKVESITTRFPTTRKSWKYYAGTGFDSDVLPLGLKEIRGGKYPFGIEDWMLDKGLANNRWMFFRDD